MQSLPAGATQFEIEVLGDKGSVATIGPATRPEELVPGQEYWGALVDGWGQVQPGECFSFTARFRDAGGAVVAVQTFTACCEPAEGYYY